MPLPARARRLASYGPLLLLLAATRLCGFTTSGNTLITDGSQTDVAAAIAAAVAGNVVQVPAGTFTWGTGGTQFVMDTPIVLTGAGPGSTTINVDTTAPSYLFNINAAVVIKGLAINNSTTSSLFAFGSTSGWRVTNITYTSSNSNPNYFAIISGSYGLVDDCTITGSSGTDELMFIRGPSNSWQTPDSLGGANNVFIEHCTFNGPGYVCDANANSRVVVRFCTITGAMKIDGHGFASNTPPRGVRHMEVYDNTWSVAGGGFDTLIEIRGGTGMFFDNKSLNDPPADGWFYLNEYGALDTWPNFNNIYQTPADYPINDQIGVGEDPKAAHSDPAYIWGNQSAAANNAGTATVLWTLKWESIPAGAITQYQTDTGNPSATFIMGPTASPADIIQQDRDFFWDGSVTGSFNGSTGVGTGTTAQMNAITPSLPGVGFWVTDQGTWNAGSPTSGELYVWNGTSWVLRYTPYAYPNPQRAPIAPTNLTIATPNYTLQWINNDDQSDETGFVIERSDNGGSFVPLTTVAPSVTTYQDTTANGTDTYSYLVFAQNAAGNSANSNTVTNAPTFTVQPTASQTVAAFSTVVLTATATGIPAPTTYQWYVSTNSGATWTPLSDGANVSGSATATVTLSNLAPTPAETPNLYQVKASNGFNPPATSNNAAVNVSLAAQTITFGALASIPYNTPPFQLTATASSGQPVSYVSSNTAVATVSGNTVTIVGIGSTYITASQAGNNVYAAAPSVQQKLVVGAATQTITFSAIAPVTYAPNDPTLTLTGSASSGLPVSYTSSNPSVATVTPTGTVTIIGAGSTTIEASQTGNAGYLAAPTVDETLTVNKAAQTITFTTIPTLVVGAAPYTLVATSSSGLTVNFITSNNYIASVSGTTLTLGPTGGSVTITAEQAGNNNYAAAPSVPQTITIDRAPAFSSEPQSAATINAGANASFSVTANALPTPTLQWQVSTDNGVTWTNLSNNATYSGALTSTLTITAASSSLNGAQYRCVATNSVTAVASTTATLTVDFAPSFTGQPSNEFVATGGNIAFTAAASGNPTPTYQWQISTAAGGSSFTNLANNGTYAGVTSGTLSITDATSAINGFVYRCVASNSVGSTDSTTAVLTVGNVAPGFTTNLQATATVAAGGNTSFTVVASGGPAPTYQWQSSPDGVNWTNLSNSSTYSGVTTATLGITDATTTMNPYYRCVATNTSGSLPSATLDLTVTTTAPNFTTNPTDQSAPSGGTVTFTVAASGNPPPTFQWQVSSDGGTTWTALSDGGIYSGTATNTLTITGVSSAIENYQYRCEATNVGGSPYSTAATFTLGDVIPSFTVQPSDETIAAGGNASFTVAASGAPAPTFQWQISTDGGSTWTNLSNGGGYGGATTSTLSITAATPSLNGAEYQCVATNTAGSTNSNPATLTVTTTAPKITAQPVSQTITAGNSTSFSVGATGNPTPTYLWQVSTDGGTTWTDLTNGGSYEGATSATLTIENAALSLNGYEYQCLVANVGSAVTTNPVILTVNSPPAGPSGQSITFNPIGSVTVDMPVTLVAAATSGLPVAFNVASGNATISGTTLTVYDTNPVVIDANQTGNASFTAAPTVSQTVTATAGAGQVYFGQAGGAAVETPNQHSPEATAAGSDIAAFINGSGTAGTLVGYLPSIPAGFVVNFTISRGSFSAQTSALTTSGTAGQVLTFNGTLSNGVLSGTIVELGVSFSATVDPAAGSSTAISGLYSAGSTYSIVGTQNEIFVLAVTPTAIAAGTGSVAANGAFTVQTAEGSQVSGTVNSAQSSISGSVTVPGGSSVQFSGVSSGLTPQVTPSSQTVSAGSTVTLSASANGATAYQWQYYGSNISGATGPTLTLPNIGEYQGGVYTALVTTSQGTAASNAATVAVTVNARLVNLSARAYVGSQPLVAGFVVNGSTPKELLLRGVGPALASFGVSGFLSAPSLTLYDSTSTPMATDVGWNSAVSPGTSTVVASIQPATTAIFNQVWAFPLPAASADCAMVATLPGGSYTQQVTGIGGASGIALAEVYDADTGTPISRLVNISARAQVGSGSQSLVAGFVVSGSTSETVLIRAVGPGLSQFGLTGVLANPQLTLFDDNATAVATDAGWGNAIAAGPSTVPAGVAPATAQLMSRVYAFTIASGSADSAMVVTLPPGTYTAQVTAPTGTTGTALVEVYELP